VGAIIIYYFRRKRDLKGGATWAGTAARFISRTAGTVEKRDPKLGLAFRYSPLECTLKGEVRTFPVAVFELHLTQEETSRLLITVEECGPDLSLEEYKHASVKDVMMQLPSVTLLHEKPSTLGGFPAVEFEYSHTDSRGERRVWCIMAVHNKRAYCVQYNSSTHHFKCIRVAHEVAKTLQILDSRPGDSFLFFTEPRYGLGMRLPLTHHVDSTYPSHDRGVIARFLTLHDTSRGGDMLDKSFMELRVLTDVEVRPTVDATLDGAMATLRRLVEGSVGEGEVLQWKTGPTNESKSAVGFLRRTPSQQFLVHNVVLKRTSAPGRYTFYDISCHGEGDENINIQYIVMCCMYGPDAFLLTAWSEEEHFPEVVASAKECFHSLCFGNQYGQDDSVMYCNPGYRFSIRVPSQCQVSEPPIGDPLVVFTPAVSASPEEITTTWVGVESTDTDSTPTMSSVPILVEPYHHEFTVQVRAQDVPAPTIRLSEIASDFVAELRGHTQARVEVEEERNTALDGVAAREVIFTQSREDGTMIKCWAVLLLHCSKQYAIQLATSADHFRQWRKIFKGMLASFRLHTVDLR
jgi:hypothetical protein